MKIGTVRKLLCTLSMGVVLLLGMTINTQAQRRHPSNGRWRGQNYGQQVSARRHYRNALRRDLKRHQRIERRVYNTERRQQREVYGNSRDWRYQQRQNRAALRTHQRAERQEFKERWKNNKKQR